MPFDEEELDPHGECAAEIKRLRAALQEIADMHIGDQPAAYNGDELVWAHRHVGHMRQKALSALKTKA